ncbi:MAG: trypsin-like serine protease [Bacteroidales bacterium]|nr:trypsin-like serine protease [Bacteroidales bacterium]MCF8344757.1 trypsin-like serine protease [Bacteroidales bacterium]MCF8352351.1 trypsin-like serine protease [Bacteroidales bacterium]MCF8377880.1 trypsin-like serine protease [Bacteroidales bacterium]
MKKQLIILILIISSFTSYSQRIVNGSDACITDFPWQIALESKNDMMQPEWKQSCGGTIIHESWILTAAHCVFQLDTMAMGTWEFRIRAGIELLSSTGGQTINVDEEYLHPQFDMMVTNEDYDIALLHLETPLTIDNNSTKIISIVTQQDSIDGVTDPGVMGTLSGWGCTDTAGTVFTDRLQYLEAPIYSLTDANQPSMWDGELEGMHLPIMPTNTAGVCFGDSGGPYVVFNQDSSAYLLAGLMSFIQATYCGDTNYADILTRVSVFESWIDSVMGVYTDIPKRNQSYINCYPNPVSGRLIIETLLNTNENIMIKITNTLGHPVYIAEYSGIDNKIEIDMSEFKNGIYILNIITSQHSYSERIIKQ